MKKLFMLLACTAAIVACTKEEVPSLDKGEPIVFGNLSTRASSLVDDISDIDEFGIWACVTGIYDTDKSYESLLANERVYRKPADTDNWTYDKTQYWVPQYMFYFFAAYPYDEHNSFQEEPFEEDGKSYMAYTLEVTADGSADTPDILTAYNSTNTNVADFNKTVPLEFSHLLTRINLKVSQDFKKDPDFDYYLTKVTITGIKGNGTYIHVPYDGSCLKFWDMNNASPAIVVKSFESPVLLRNVGAVDPVVVVSVWDEKGLLLVPQEILNGAVRVRIDYRYDVNPEDDDLGAERYVEGTIPATSQWQSGNDITYTIEIAEQSDISFSTPAIKPWGAPQTGGTIIIK